MVLHLQDALGRISAAPSEMRKIWDEIIDFLFFSMKRRIYKNFLICNKRGEDLIFLLSYLYIHWNDSVKYGISNIFAIPAKELFLIHKKTKRTFKGYSKVSLAIIRFRCYFHFGINQDFRNIFLLKNISIESFYQFLKIIGQNPFNCDEKDLDRCLNIFHYHLGNRVNIDLDTLCEIVYQVWQEFIQTK